MCEIWKNIGGFEGYQVSNFGNVRSCKSTNGVGKLRDSYRSLKLSVDNRKGYYRIGLYKGDKQIKMFVHRLVLETFIGPCPEGMEARHLDGDPQNNYVENLAWGTCVENRYDRIKHGRNNNGENHPLAILTEENVGEIKRLLKEANLHHREIGKMFGVSRDTISKIKQGKKWAHV